MTPRALTALPKAMRQMKQEMQAEYAAMQPSRFRRRRPGVTASGVGADAHFGSEASYFQMREYVRAMDRDDAFIGRLADCAVEQTSQTGYSFDPDTGDVELNTLLYKAWVEFAIDPDLCDIQGEHTYSDLTALWHRHEIVDGDIFSAVTEDGPIETFEGDRCRNPSYVRSRNIVLGVELDSNRKRQHYYFTREAISNITQRLALDKFAPLAARDEAGHRQVMHLYDPTRVSQTRGITAFHAIFDIAGMFEDVNFALLIKQQMAACIGLFLQRAANAPGGMGQDDLRLGEQSLATGGAGYAEAIEAFSPGLFAKGRPGEEMKVLTANVPSSETMTHLRFLLQVIGINLGLPLAMVMLDPKDSGSFSAWRGIFDQAKLGFVFNQERMIGRVHRPIWKAKVRQWLLEPKHERMREIAGRANVNPFAVKIKGSRWPYIQPLHDAQAKTHKVHNLLSSLRREVSDDGGDFDDIYKETVDDNADSITYAIQRVQKLRQALGNDARDVTWRDLLPRDMPSGTKGETKGEAAAENRSPGRPEEEE